MGKSAGKREITIDDLRGFKQLRRVRKRARVRARPFMGPAFEQEQPKLPAMWRDSIK